MPESFDFGTHPQASQREARKTLVFDGQETASVGFLYEPAHPA